MFKGVETPVVRVDSNKYRPWRFPGAQAYIIVTKIYHQILKFEFRIKKFPGAHAYIIVTKIHHQIPDFEFRIKISRPLGIDHCNKNPSSDT